MAFDSALNLRFRGGAQTVLLHQTVRELNLPETNRKILETGSLQTVGGERNNFGVGKSIRHAQKFYARLIKFALAPRLILPEPKYARIVRKF